MATMAATATCRCTSSVAAICLAAKLRPANIDGAAGSLEEVSRIVGQIRARWPAVRIVLRADSGFARDALMTWCEASGVDYLFGLARNARLVAQIEAELAEAAAESTASGAPARRFKDSCGRRARAGPAVGASWARPSGPRARPIRASS